MADDEPCGSNTESRFLQNFENVTEFTQQTLKAVLQATKCSNEMPAAGDDFDYYSSFQGFQDVMSIEGKRILHIIQSILKHQNVKINLGNSGGAADIEDKLDLLMDANDQILERAGSWLDEAAGLKKTDTSLVVASATPKKLVSTASWNKKAQVGGSTPSTPSYRLLSARNIQRPQLRFKTKVDNRRRPFIPIIKEKPNAMKSLEESLQLPEGVNPEMTEAQDFQYPHPYQFELDNLQYTEEQLSPATVQEPLPLAETTLNMVNTVEGLRHMVDKIKQTGCKEIAVDLEHHNYRTFQGMTCLVQLSTRNEDFVVDGLDLRSDLHILNEIFTDPAITKVFHGAESDIGWLQRDFGVYVINMFDTGQAARVLNFSRFSLAHLLQQYCDITADKQYQLADWRIRPLPDELLKYAREDTHYLLYIYDKLKNELLERGNEQKNLLLSVLQRSNQVAAKIYQKPLFLELDYFDLYKKKKKIFNSQQMMEGGRIYQKPLFLESDYFDLYKKNKKIFNSQQMMALRDLYAWRDEIARLEDESYGYVLPNHMLLQICGILPREKQGILACCNPIPPLVRQYLNELHAMIVKARESPLHKLEPLRETQPTQLQHPKYDVNSLLNCPHDLSHAGEMIEYKEPQTALLDTSLISRSSTMFPSKSPNKSVIVLKDCPLLTAFDFPKKNSSQTEAQRKAAKIKESFVSPYFKYLPRETKQNNNNKVGNQAEVSWKLVPSSTKRKSSTNEDKTSETGPPPSKRSRTQLSTATDIEPAATSAQTSLESPVDPDSNERIPTPSDAIEGSEETVPTLTEDDKKALPQDLEIPLRFQMPSKKKKKRKDKNRDIDIIQKVQDSVQTELERLKNSTLALGQNPGDAQPVVKDNVSGKKKKKMKKDKSEKTLKTEVSVTVNEGTGEDEGSKSEEFKPYDYSNAAEKLNEGTSQQKDYYDPVSKMKKSKGPKVSKNKLHKNKNKSYTWKT